MVHQLKVTALASGKFSDHPALVKYSRPVADPADGASPTYESTVTRLGPPSSPWKVLLTLLLLL